MKFKINIPPNANELIRMLHQNGHSAYVVGGCVRDSILGRIPNDWDICTSATPDEMLEIFKDKRVIETGLQHGTITVVMGAESFEITTYRIDGAYSDNRRPDNVTFTNDLVEDLRRRDFTINAMAYNDTEGLIDPFNGMDDLAYQRIDCVGCAKDRFEEDALRILRAIRFAAQLGFSIMPETDWQIHLQCNKLKNISVERINSEFCKIAVTESFCVELVLYYDVFSLFIPELADMMWFNQNNPYHDYNVFTHTMHALENCNSTDLTTRLAVFFHDFGKPHCYQDDENGVCHFKGHGKISCDIADAIMRRLRFDNQTRNDVCELVYYHDATFEVGTKYVKRWLNKIGLEQYKRLLEVRKADIRGQKIQCDESRIDKVNAIEKLLDVVLQGNECFTMKELAVNGNDLMNIGYKPGKILGNALQVLLQKVIDGELPNEKDKILDFAHLINKE